MATIEHILDNGGYKERLEFVLGKMFVDDNGCWIWTGCTDPETGYGHINLYNTKKVKVHRFIAYCFHGLDLFDLKLLACHSCDARNCINPFHIWIGTKSENFRDSVKKGRWHGGHYKNFTNHLVKKDWGKYAKE